MSEWANPISIEPETDSEKLRQHLRDSLDLMIKRIELGELAMPFSNPMVMSPTMYQLYLNGTNEDRAAIEMAFYRS